MSHFSCVVILPDTITDQTDLDAITTHVTKVMEPYSEEREVPAYDEGCWCVTRNLTTAVNKKLAAEFGDPRYNDVIDKFRKTFERSGDVEADEKAWKEHIKPFTDAEERYGQEAREAGEEHPDPDCSECGGTGIVKSTYNPDSKWDWYMVGGRWDGKLLGLEWEPHLETCTLCGGSGKRPDAASFGPSWMESTGGCNGCKGTGKAEKWPTDDVYSSPDRNICTMKITGREAPYSLITPDGEWHARAKMGWFGVSRDENDIDEWQENWTTLREGTYADNLAIMLDCHI